MMPMTLADTAARGGPVESSIIGSLRIALQVVKRDRVSAVQSEAVDHLLPAIARICGLSHASSVRTLERPKLDVRWSLRRVVSAAGAPRVGCRGVRLCQ